MSVISFVACNDEEENKEKNVQVKVVDFSKLIGEWKDIKGTDTIKFMNNNTFLQKDPDTTINGSWAIIESMNLLVISYNNGRSFDLVIEQLDDQYLYWTVDGGKYGFRKISNISTPTNGENNNNTIVSTGTIMLKNQSPYNAYEVSLDNITYTLEAGATKSISNKEAGLYDAKITQKSGYVSGYAYVGKYSGELKTGGILNYLLPELGTITINNTESDPYIITINGRNFGTIAAQSTKKITTDVGYYSIHVEQASGYLFWASEKTYTGTIKDGGNNLTIVLTGL